MSTKLNLLSRISTSPKNGIANANMTMKRFVRFLSYLAVAIGSQTLAWGGTMTLSNLSEIEWGTTTNPTGDVIPLTMGNALLYPSEITVAGIDSQQVTQVEVTLNGLSHTFPGDLDILLVGPQGQQTILMSDSNGGADFVNLDLTFSAAAELSLPVTASTGTPSSGTFLPSNFLFPDTFSSPGPGSLPGPLTDLTVFNGTDPNGTWQLFVVDDAGGDTGNISGWTLNLSIPDALVSNTDDDGPGSLRAAILNAPDGAVICFSPDIFNTENNKTITLATPLVLGNKTLTIDASSVGGVTLDGDGTASQLINNFNGGNLTLNAMNFTGATFNAIFNANSTLTINNCSVYGNQGGGAIFNSTGGTCAATNSTIAFNTGEFGAGFLSRGSSATLTHVTIANNTGTGGSAGIVHENGTLTLDRCLLSNPDSAASSGRDIGGAGGTIIATTPNFIRSIGSTNFYAASFPSGPLVGTDTVPIEPLLVGDNVANLFGEPLFNYGGPTLALMPQLGSPVIDASAAATGVDQRGVAAVGNRDLGAIETTWNDNITTTVPTGFLADITIPQTTISNFPSDLSLALGSLPFLLDGQSNTVLVNTEVNWGLTLSPTGPEFSLSGISLTSSLGGNSDSSPTSFLLLGSNDLNSFQPLVSATLNPFSTLDEKQTIFFASSLPHFAHYRLIFPSSSAPSSTSLALGEVELLGSPLPPFSELRITDFDFTTSSGTTLIATFDTIPGTTYAVFIGRPTTFSTGSGSQVPSTEFTADSWSSTSVPVGSSASSNFWRIQEIVPES